MFQALLKPVENSRSWIWKPCIAGRLRRAEGCRPYRLRYLFVLLVMLVFVPLNPLFAQEAIFDRTNPPSSGSQYVPNTYRPNAIASSPSVVSRFLNRISPPIPRITQNPVVSGFTTAQDEQIQSFYDANSVFVKYEQWFDCTRNRAIPVKIYYPAVTSGLCPVIIFSHGLGGSLERCAYLGQTWASRGFISVHIQHLGMDDTVWKKKIRPIKELKEVYDQVWSGRMQANDIRFAINQITILSTMPGNSVWQHVDMTRLGVAGYDLGGLAAMLVSGQIPPDGGELLQDERVKALIVMSPPIHDDISRAGYVYQRMNLPTLFFTGTEDNGVVGTTKAWQRRIPFDYMSVADRYLITYQGTDHMIYGGHVRSGKERDDRKYQSNIAQASLLFWQAYLEDDPAMIMYFHGRTLGGITGLLGRVERRLGATAAVLSAAE